VAETHSVEDNNNHNKHEPHALPVSGSCVPLCSLGLPYRGPLVPKQVDPELCKADVEAIQRKIVDARSANNACGEINEISGGQNCWSAGATLAGSLPGHAGRRSGEDVVE
jgi:hypothetical protein